MTVTLDSITRHLNARGVSKEWFPEHLILVDDCRCRPRQDRQGRSEGDIKKRFADQVR